MRTDFIIKKRESDEYVTTLSTDNYQDYTQLKENLLRLGEDYYFIEVRRKNGLTYKCSSLRQRATARYRYLRNGFKGPA